MARPETTRDIEIETVAFGNIYLDKIATDSALLKGYTAFIEAVGKAGATAVKTTYNGVEFSRPATQEEALAQLRTAQSNWDQAKTHYETLAAVGEVEYNFQRTSAEEWVKSEGMPFPPEVEESLPIPSVDDTLAAIEDLADEEVDA